MSETNRSEMTDDIQELLDALPEVIGRKVTQLQRNHPEYGQLVEIVMDLGRLPEARFQFEEIELSDIDVTRQDLAAVAEKIGAFGDDNRAGIERTLHRISAIRNRTGEIVGLTCRIGRAVFGTIAIISDLIESGESVLILGRPGVGKTTMLRETARVLADELRKRVVVVDTSNEIAGDGDIPHPAIGRARRMQVPTPTAQDRIMIEAVENHMPQVIVIDEIGTELEAMAARTIAERGVQLIGTAHGNTLENLMLNPTLTDLIGGIQSVTLSDEEARRRGSQKSILERKAPPTFGVMVEIVERDEVIVHKDVAATVDALLRGAPPRSERRKRNADGTISTSASEDERRDPTARQRSHRQVTPTRTAETLFDDALLAEAAARVQQIEAEAQEAELMDTRAVAPPLAAIAKGRGTAEKPLRIFPFGVSRNRLDASISRMNVPAIIVRSERDADIVMTLKNAYRRKAEPVRDAELRGIPVYVLRSNTATQMENVIRSIFPSTIDSDVDGEDDDVPKLSSRERRMHDVTIALSEAEEAIAAIMKGAPATALRPQSPTIRRMQHEMAERYNLGSRSRGRDPFRHVEIYRPGVQ
ncbi:MAG: AAA family ATPase [Thermomicrobiales bacterium]|nr:AAA family ATPase [Thermomicrobiales bacterium]MCO5218731.1 AAA family ATPase [Thermomicrobiales bacterium]MCO5225758.1 AAA family ATPase [Thermomicrobiales bacterium]MCO5228005.1 AAA family ATPase [Thermomicrobiales bacterium]